MASPDVNALADRYVEMIFRFDPQWGTFYGIAHADNVSLPDNTLDGIKKHYAAEDSLLAQVLLIDQSGLNAKDLITYKILRESLESATAVRLCKSYLWTVNHLDAFYIWFRYIGDAQPVGDAVARTAALNRWHKIPEFIRNDLQNNKAGAEQGYALPKVIIQQVVAQMDQLIASPLEDNVFYLPAKRDTDAAFRESLKKIISDEIMPEIKTYRAFLANEYMPKARTELSIRSIPNGDDCYAAFLRSNTTLSATPEEVFDWGQKAIASRETKIKEIGEKVYGLNEIAKIKEAFRNDRTNYFTSKEEMLKVAQAAIDKAKLAIPNYFGLNPKAEIVLEAISPLEEKTGYSSYSPASDDGKRPAKYIQQTYKPETRTRGELEVTAFHETYPGHHLQIAISRELPQSHPMTKYAGNSGFAEGWARYTESLAAEMKLYSSEKNTLAMYMGLPTGMVVDPGIHFKNWTREQAIEFTMQNQADMTRGRAENYVDRISVWPGQMTTYGVGEMYFKNLRSRAQEALGNNFDLKSFHDECLKNGTVPLNFIDEQINKWVEGKKGK
ncbi:hypothetical protein WSM22_06370 [Cytophagales bacterium WSM2-2]|nr:hypothetical protein WSM22_06370 [Cytophagales bacterium WSM2-2]